MMLQLLGLLLVGSSLASGVAFASSAEPRVATTIAKWQHESNRNQLIVDVSDLLTPAQRDIVNSGFSTFTLLAISENKFDISESIPETRVVCSVKYDTWEERYQMIRVDPPPVETITIKDYRDWAQRCLRHDISNMEGLSKLKKGETLHALLQVRQSSPEEAAKIKNWLVRQQSGFMQGLYAHMLGDFQFKGTIKIKIIVPPPPSKELPDAKDKNHPNLRGP